MATVQVTQSFFMLSKLETIFLFFKSLNKISLKPNNDICPNRTWYSAQIPRNLALVTVLSGNKGSLERSEEQDGEVSPTSEIDIASDTALSVLSVTT